MIQEIYNSIDIIRAELVTINAKPQFSHPPLAAVATSAAPSSLPRFFEDGTGESSSSLLQQLSAASSVIANRSEVIDSLKAEALKLRAEVEEKDRALTASRQRFAAATQALDETRLKLSDAEVRHVQDQRHLNQLTERMSRCAKEGKLFKEDAASLQQQFALIKASAASCTSRIDQLAARNHHLESSLAEQTRACNGMTELREQLDASLLDLTVLRERNVELESSLSDLQKWCAACSPEVDRLVGCNSALSRELSSTRDALQQALITTDELQKRLLGTSLQPVVVLTSMLPSMLPEAHVEPLSSLMPCLLCESTQHEHASQVAILTEEMSSLRTKYEAVLSERVLSATTVIDGARNVALNSIPDLSAAMSAAEKQQTVLNSMQDALTQCTDEVTCLREYSARLEMQLQKLLLVEDRPRQCMACVLPMEASSPSSSCLKCGSYFHPACVGAVPGQKILCPLHRQAGGPVTRGRGGRR